MPFVGTVPAIKPAAEQTQSGLVSVLATFGTMRRDYTRDLIQSFAQSCEVRLVGSANLAPLAEAAMRGDSIADDAISGRDRAGLCREGRTAHRHDRARLHALPVPARPFERLAPWPVEWIDPAPAIARRVVAVVPPSSASEPASGAAFLTSGKAWPEALREFLGDSGSRPVN